MIRNRDTTIGSRGTAIGGGVVAAAAALGAGELVGGLLATTSPLLAVGRAVIDLQPPGAKDLVVALFGENDKVALEVAIVVVVLAIGAGLGLARPRWPGLASAAIGGVGVVGFLAALADPQSSVVSAALPSAAAVLAGVGALALLVPLDNRVHPDPDPVMDWGRRRLFVRAGGLAATAVVAGYAGRSLLRAGEAGTGRDIRYPPPSTSASLPAGAELAVDGITPLVVPNDRFYRIDTALLVPSVDPATWRLRVHGLVERETTLSFDELLALPLIEQYVTIACVSNEVGGDLVGNAKWTGVRLRDVLDIAGVLPTASQLVGRSVDGWTAGMPTAWILDPHREAMIAVRMNDEPLPRQHGFPARLIVPGLYGYVSATKWLAELELTTMDAFDAYWVPLGWAKEAPVLTQSRIDVPRPGQRVAAGSVAFGGVAWAPDRGVARVEVAIDGVWRDARISTPISDATWVQWRYDWDAEPGRHEVRVRATDGTGEVQTERRTRPVPDGARGHHAITIDVSS